MPERSRSDVSPATQKIIDGIYGDLPNGRPPDPVRAPWDEPDEFDAKGKLIYKPTTAIYNFARRRVEWHSGPVPEEVRWQYEDRPEGSPAPTSRRYDKESGQWLPCPATNRPRP